MSAYDPTLYNPGDQAFVTVRDDGVHRVTRFATPSARGWLMTNGRTEIKDADVVSVRSLLVTDPTDANDPVVLLISERTSTPCVHVSSFLTTLLPEPKSTKPDEPTRAGTTVVDTDDAEWLRTRRATAPWMNVQDLPDGGQSTRWAAYADIDVDHVVPPPTV